MRKTTNWSLISIPTSCLLVTTLAHGSQLHPHVVYSITSQARFVGKNDPRAHVTLQLRVKLHYGFDVKLILEFC